MAISGNGHGEWRKPALGGLLEATTEGPDASREAVLAYSQKLSQKVIGLEAENLELQDAKAKIARENAELLSRIISLEEEVSGLKAAGQATYQERNISVHLVQDALRQKQGQVMLLDKEAKQERQRSEALTLQNRRFRGVADQLQHERHELARQVLALETTVDAMAQDGAARADSLGRLEVSCNELDKRIRLVTSEREQAELAARAWRSEASEIQLVHEELATERANVRLVSDQLQISLGEAHRLQQRNAEGCQLVERLRAEAAQLRQQEEATAAEPLRLEEQLRMNQETVHALRQRIAELDDQVATASRDRMAAQSANAELRSMLHAAQQQVAERARRADELVHQNLQTERAADVLATKRAEAEQGLANITTEVHVLRNRCEKIRAENAALTAKAQHFEAENVVLHGKLQGAELHLQGLREECAQLVERLKQQTYQQLRPHPGELGTAPSSAALRGAGMLPVASMECKDVAHQHREAAHQLPWPEPRAPGACVLACPRLGELACPVPGPVPGPLGVRPWPGSELVREAQAEAPRVGRLGAWFAEGHQPEPGGPPGLELETAVFRFPGPPDGSPWGTEQSLPTGPQSHKAPVLLGNPADWPRAPSDGDPREVHSLRQVRPALAPLEAGWMASLPGFERAEREPGPRRSTEAQDGQGARRRQGRAPEVRPGPSRSQGPPSSGPPFGLN